MTETVFWCSSHHRIATHKLPDGKACCDPNNGGITLPCVVFETHPLVAAIAEYTHEQLGFVIISKEARHAMSHCIAKNFSTGEYKHD